MPVLVVAPRIVIASPMLGINTEIPKHIAVNTNVAKAFCPKVNLYSGFNNISSKVSLQGSRVKGVAKSTTIIIPKSDM